MIILDIEKTVMIRFLNIYQTLSLLSLYTITKDFDSFSIEKLSTMP